MCVYVCICVCVFVCVNVQMVSSMQVYVSMCARARAYFIMLAHVT